MLIQSLILAKKFLDRNQPLTCILQCIISCLDLLYHGASEFQAKCSVQVRKLGEGERDTEKGPASPLQAKKPSLLKRAYDLTMGNPADSTASSARRAGTAFSIMEPQYAEMDRQTADKRARR